MGDKNSPVSRIVAWVLVSLLFALFAFLEIYARVLSRVSDTARTRIDNVTNDYPVIFGIGWTAIIVLAVTIAFFDYHKSRSKGSLIRLIAWLTFFLGMIIYASFSSTPFP